MLERGRDAFEAKSLLDEAAAAALPPEEALRLYLRQYLAPLRDRGRVARYLRIHAWEGARPSPIFANFVRDAAFPVLTLARIIADRLLPPGAGAEERLLAALWLAHQPFAFVRDADLLRAPPFSLTLDGAFLDRLVEQLTGWALAGLRGDATPELPVQSGKRVG